MKWITNWKNETYIAVGPTYWTIALIEQTTWKY